MKKILALAASATVLVAAVPALAATKTVRVDDNVFSPKTLTVKKGTKLKFTWVGDAPHNVRGAGINIGIRRSGSKTVTARRGGTLVCTIHPGMQMKLRVRR